MTDRAIQSSETSSASATADYSAVPAALRNLSQWLCWRLEEKSGAKKPAKMPYYANGKRRTGQQGSPADRAALVDFDAAVAAKAKLKAAGIGFAFLPGDGLIGIDLDKMVDVETGEISPLAKSIIDACASYTEWSPSGNGFHIVVTGTTKTIKDNGIGVEVFCESQFFTFTGRHLTGTPTEVAAIDLKVLRRLRKTVEAAKGGISDPPRAAPAGATAFDSERELIESALNAIDPNCGYDLWVKVGMALHSALAGTGFALWDAWSARSDKYPGSIELRQHWDSFKPGGVKEGSLFFAAKQAGWIDPRKKPKKAPAEPKSRAVAIQLSEDALATQFASDNHGRLVYAHTFGTWFIYDATVGVWKADSLELVFHWVREFVRRLNREQKEKWLRASVVAAVERLARRDPLLAIQGDEFDANPWLLGTPDGVLDLRNGRSVPANPQHYVSKRTTVSPGASGAPIWTNFLIAATAGSVELMEYLQRLAGYCLTGETREEVLIFAHGSGGNGKGVFMNTLRAILGDYAKQAPMQVLLANNGDRHPTELANLNGARLVLASESPEGRRWDEERVKSLTGRDAISARFMNRDFFEFIPRFKLLVASNHKPRIRTVDDAWRRRLHLVPFIHKPAKPDEGLKDRLRDEYPAILQWMIVGAEWWSREGLGAPSVVTEATDEYFREEDVIGLWFAEKCEDRPSAVADRKLLYASYERWCHDMGHAAANMHAVTRWLKARGYEQDTKKSARPILGVEVLQEPAL